MFIEENMYSLSLFSTYGHIRISQYCIVYKVVHLLFSLGIILQMLPDVSPASVKLFSMAMPLDGCGFWWLAAVKNSVVVWWQDLEVLLSALTVAFGKSL